MKKASVLRLNLNSQIPLVIGDRSLCDRVVRVGSLLVEQQTTTDPDQILHQSAEEIRCVFDDI